MLIKNNTSAEAYKAMLNNPEMSLQAKGVMALMLTHENGESISLDELQGMSKNGSSALRNALTEAEKLGYLKRELYREHGKIAGTNWIINV